MTNRLVVRTLIATALGVLLLVTSGEAARRGGGRSRAAAEAGAPAKADQVSAWSTAQGRTFRTGQLVIQGSPERLSRRYNVLKHYPLSNLTVVEVPAGKERARLRAARNRGSRAGLNLRVEAFMAPNDAYFMYQWNLVAVQAEGAWDVSDGSGATVAVLDTGVQQSGATDGIDCVLPGYNTIDDTTNVDDGHSHGTHVASTVAQATNNATGLAGLAHGACILPVKVLDNGGYGTLADIAEGVYWAVDNGAQVINMSLGLSADAEVFNDPLVDPALDYAQANDVTVVCASGNDGNRNNVSYPASYSTTIAVGATDAINDVTSYSNGGTGLDLVAPGGDFGADLNGDYLPDAILQETYKGGWAYFFYQGTSMASPHVAAAAALLYASGAATTPSEVFTALTSSALDVGAAGFDTDSGFGMLQAHDALLVGPPACQQFSDAAFVK